MPSVVINLRFIRCIAAAAAALWAGAACPALAADLNAFRASHTLPPLSYSATLTSLASDHARDLARRNALDHKDFKKRVADLVSGMAAENVLYVTCKRADAEAAPLFGSPACGCDDEACAVRIWAKSAGHRKNMLLKGVSAYGIASAAGDSGRKYWVMVLGN